MTTRSPRWLHRCAIGLLVIGVVAGLRIADGKAPDVMIFDGYTMGTTWVVKVVPERDSIEAATLEQSVIETLERVNGRMSTWDPESELSRFNASTSTDWFPVSHETRAVVAASIEASRRTDGAFDATVGPLVDLWGFGPERVVERPSETALAAARAQVGWQNISVREAPPAIRKTHPGARVDLSAIAKGYAVDAVTETIETAGLGNYLVEVGGEIRGNGLNPAGESWRIAVEKPTPGGRAVQRVISLDQGAVATSGDYRNVIELDGKPYGHAIDPKTGNPVPRGVASATIVGRSAMEADAIATALLVMGPETAEAFVQREELAALLLIHDDGGTIREFATPEFTAYMIDLGDPR